jgi:pyruvate dehydrogenase E2 component (dihydrolipoamide acetyltransferase)
VSGPKGEVTIQEPTPAERTVTRRVAEARATVPDLELTVSLSAPRTYPTESLVSACAAALSQHPRVNAAYRDGHFELYSRINIGVVLAAPDQYLIPTVFDADQKPVSDLGAEFEQLRAGAAAGRLSAPAFSGATFTLWNAAEHGITRASIPVLTPQAAVLSAGTESLNLVCDHRILYGTHATAFLTTVRRLLEQEV